MVLHFKIFSQNVYIVNPYQVWPGTPYSTFTDPVFSFFVCFFYAVHNDD
uniref:Uncharacterized protein n=1 Tax=Anguilla anguilla TaxID=7936 RepID=A0A0E9XS10_ANGAN